MITLGLCVLLTFQPVKPPPAVSPELLANAEKGDAEAQVQLGARVCGRRGVPVDHGKAVVHYRRAADQGHALAQYLLGSSYFQGEGVDESDLEGLRWIRKAADQGNRLRPGRPAGPTDRGQRGLDEDERLSFFWNHQAASQGYSVGAFGIANVYEIGEVLPKDYARAYAWRSLGGTLMDWDGRKPDEDPLRELAKMMTKPQLASAAKLLREWGGKAPPLATISPQPASPAPKADADAIALSRTLTAEFQRSATSPRRPWRGRRVCPRWLTWPSPRKRRRWSRPSTTPSKRSCRRWPRRGSTLARSIRWSPRRSWQACDVTNGPSWTRRSVPPPR